MLADSESGTAARSAITRQAGLRVLAAISLALVSVCGVRRNGEYFELLAQFGRAEPRERVRRGQTTPEWDFEVPLAGGSAMARVQGRAGMDVVRVTYSDERESRTLYKYVDYSSPSQVRVTNDLL